jgi:hypothetical protein
MESSAVNSNEIGWIIIIIFIRYSALLGYLKWSL